MTPSMPILEFTLLMHELIIFFYQPTLCWKWGSPLGMTTGFYNTGLPLPWGHLCAFIKSAPQLTNALVLIILQHVIVLNQPILHLKHRPDVICQLYLNNPRGRGEKKKHKQEERIKTKADSFKELINSITLQARPMKTTEGRQIRNIRNEIRNALPEAPGIQ